MSDAGLGRRDADRPAPERDRDRERTWLVVGIVCAAIVLLTLLGFLLTRDDGEEDPDTVLGPTTPPAATDTPSPTPTPTPSPTPTATPTATDTPSPTASPTSSPTATPEPTATPTPSPTATAAPTPTSTQTTAPEPTVSPSPTATPPEVETAEGPEPVQQSGEGSQATEPFVHEGGLAIVRVAHNGVEDFAVLLVGQDGETSEQVVETSGEYRGVRAFGLPEGNYAFEVEADGLWGLSFEQPRYTDGPSLPVTAQGEGDSVTDPFRVTEDATVSLTLTTEGEEPLEGRLLSAEGEVAAEFNASDGETVEAELDAGLYLLEVRAEGMWRAEIGPS